MVPPINQTPPKKSTGATGNAPRAYPCMPHAYNRRAHGEQACRRAEPARLSGRRAKPARPLDRRAGFARLSIREAYVSRGTLIRVPGTQSTLIRVPRYPHKGTLRTLIRVPVPLSPGSRQPLNSRGLR
ncbi:hypothetical protein PCANC_17331 [Puccinia coronata f. sp. avenae]|uniref:Uncharacterized protein n=1 Tax=Puccinia coronata f. sp. avenae TaxID=200324 RepID=A0A2N5UU93_9BASI|nr:hypothetical protein PCANC_17331 [Puccinia coronata f. sp. avenae]